MTRWLGGTLSGNGLVPASTKKGGIWTLMELGGSILPSYQWHPDVAVTASTFSIADAGSYSFSTQNIGDAHTDKAVYVFVAGSSATTGATAVTIAGSAATQIVAAAGATTKLHAQLWGTRIISTTTTATVAITYGATQSRCLVHVFRAFGANYPTEAVASTAQNIAITSSGETFTVDIPPGAFAISGSCIIVSAATGSYTAGSTLAARSSWGSEAGQVFTGITNATTAFRTGHTITTTHSTGALTDPGCGFVAVIK